MASDDEGFGQHWKRLIEGRNSGRRPLSPECVRSLYDVIDLAPVTASSIRKTRDAHSGMSGPRAPLRRFLQALLKDYIGWLGANFDPTIRWKDLDFIRAEWAGPLIIKGILDPEDARAAADLGADGIVVSNHGGRQLDGALSSIRALPAIADAVGDHLTVLADSGVRSGLDVVRMLASGARGVLLGRAWVYAIDEAAVEMRCEELCEVEHVLAE